MEEVSPLILLLYALCIDTMSISLFGFIVSSALGPLAFRGYRRSQFLRNTLLVVDAHCYADARVSNYRYRLRSYRSCKPLPLCVIFQHLTRYRLYIVRCSRGAQSRTLSPPPHRVTS